jgi:hypothetical protein
MKQEVYPVGYPVALVLVLVVFLSAIFSAQPNISFAASAKKKSPAVVKMSAVDYTEARIKELRGALKITADQEELWNNLIGVMRENAKGMDALTKEKAESKKTTNAVERIKLHSEITKAHLDQLEKFIPPFEAFYDSMSDEQKKITDTIFQTGKHGKQKRK